jgi:ribosomal protein S27AE
MNGTTNQVCPQCGKANDMSKRLYADRVQCDHCGHTWTPQQSITEAALLQFTGTESYTRHWTKRLVMTEGVMFLVDHGAAWLLDAVASYQPQLGKVGFQLWKLEVFGTAAILTCREDSGNPVLIEQRIEWTDFPLPEITLYVIDSGDVGWVAMLPTEY